MYSDELRKKANDLVSEIKAYWGTNVSIQGLDFPDHPYDEFEITTTIYDKYTVGFAYDRSTVDIGVKVEDNYIILNKLTNEQVFRGFKSYYPENLLHNFKVLDKTLKDVAEQD